MQDVKCRCLEKQAQLKICQVPTIGAHGISSSEIAITHEPKNTEHDFRMRQIFIKTDALFAKWHCSAEDGPNNNELPLQFQ